MLAPGTDPLQRAFGAAGGGYTLDEAQYSILNALKTQKSTNTETKQQFSQHHYFGSRNNIHN